MKSFKMGFTAAVLASALGCSAGTDDSESVGAVREALNPATQFYAPAPNPGAKIQIRELKRAHDKASAALIDSMVETPRAVWLVQGTPSEVEKQARQVVNKAAKGQVPVLVAYNIPFRDCAQFSAGGATTKAAYVAWIDAVAKGIGDRNAIVILEPDGLGIIPFYNPFADRDGWVPPGTLEWCQPSEANPETAASERFEMLSYAVTALKAGPNTKVYLDGTHSGWLGAGDAADRLIQANVAEADGFFLNVSNYQEDQRLVKYGTWIAKCLWFSTADSSWGKGHPEWCGSQYSPASPDDFSTWSLTDDKYANEVETMAGYPGDAGLERFVIDSSRNGLGPWVATPEQQALGDVQDWCNPPDRGLGKRPTANTGNALLDAYLWVKVPGESDGFCNRWAPPGSPDPVRGMMNPAAGEWFSEMALELAINANPPL